MTPISLTLTRFTPEKQCGVGEDMGGDDVGRLLKIGVGEVVTTGDGVIQSTLKSIIGNDLLLLSS
jgi:hypothetical protein